jgi:nicotinamidase/pyrazinamidase
MKEVALGLIDVQAGFMPAEEGDRLHRNGFGELPISHGQDIVPTLNELVAAYAFRGAHVFTTQDWHPYETAHFSDTPDYQTTWPRHCVAGTEGADVHPGLLLPHNYERFTKGFVHLQRSEEDTSYSGYYATNALDETLPDWLEKKQIKAVHLGGLALDYCVGQTALDIRES